MLTYLINMPFNTCEIELNKYIEEAILKLMNNCGY